MNELLQTVLHSRHRALNAALVEFAGWEMPIRYGSILEEHRATRERAGLFDVAHMGRLLFRGDGALPLLKRLLPTDLNSAQPGAVIYSVLCNEAGMALDDLTLLIRPEEYLMVVNAANRAKVLRWIETQRPAFSAEILDQTFSSAMLALQGPLALELAGRHFGRDFTALNYFQFCAFEHGGRRLLASRTGYTGEDGLEFILDNAGALELWDALLAAGAAPVGLGARDTLRLECGYPLYGHELSPEINPLEARLGFVVNSPDDYIGRAALLNVRASGVKRRLAAFKVAGRQIAREGDAITRDGRRVGAVSSGSFCPTLGCGAGMALLDPELTRPGTPGLSVEIRGKPAALEIVHFPLRPKNVAAKIKTTERVHPDSAAASEPRPSGSGRSPA